MQTASDDAASGRSGGCLLAIQDGLAVYSVGQGTPVFRMPYPHGFTTQSSSDDALTRLLLDAGFRVITFDPPGAYRSARRARVTMAEMLFCADEALNTLNIDQPVALIGHSMGSFCALAYTLEHPERVARLVLVGALAGRPARRDYRAMPYCWRMNDLDFWRNAYWGARLMFGFGNLAVHKRLDELIHRVSYVDPRYLTPPVIELDDHRQPAPIRDRWTQAALRHDYSARLGEIRVPTLILVGRHDPQTPVPYSQDLNRGIVGSRLTIFEHSGHAPFVEESEAFTAEVKPFLSADH